jgi:hypothetical protein
MAGWYAIVTAGSGKNLSLEQVAEVSRLAAIGTWRYTQGIYRFHPAVFDALKTTEMTGDIPCEVLYRLPEWCPYIETPGLDINGLKISGFFIHLEWDANDGRHELRFLVDSERGLVPIPLHLGKWPLVEALERMIEEADRHSDAARIEGLKSKPEPLSIVSQIAMVVSPLVSLVLYLCAGDPEYRGQKPVRYRPTKTKKGIRLFPPPGPTFYHLADRIGDQIEGVRNIGSPCCPRPHIRRAHWHGYWSGPRTGQRRFEFHWLPPILVNREEMDQRPYRSSSSEVT